MVSNSMPSWLASWHVSPRSMVKAECLRRGVAVGLARAVDDEADRRHRALGEHAARSGIDAQHGDLAAPLREDAERLGRDSALPSSGSQAKFSGLMRTGSS